MRKTVLRWLAYAAAFSAMIPAIIINIDSASHQGAAWTAFGIGSVIMAAAFVAVAARRFSEHRRIEAAFSALLALLFVAMNVTNALTNVAALSDDGRTKHRTQNAAVTRLSSQLSRITAARSQNAAIAAETPSAAYRQQIEGVKAASSARWQSTDGCAPEKITQGISRALCSSIADLSVKAAASEERERQDREIADLSRRIETSGGVQVSATPFVDRIVSLMAAAGVTVGEGSQSIIANLPDVFRAVMAEIMAALGPSAILTLFGLDRLAEKSSQKMVANPRKPQQESPQMPAARPETILADDPIHGFIATHLERREGSIMPTGEVWDLWVAHCRSRGIEMGTRKGFTMSVKHFFAYDANNKRARFLNVRAKTVGVRLAVNNR